MIEAQNYGLVSIIIVNYNGEDLLYDCLKSLFAQSYSPVEIIVVDNASSDKSVEIVKNNFPNVNLINASKNLGFAGGNNLGAQHSHGKYLLLLNNDTTVHPDFLIEMLAAMQETGASVVTSKVITEGVPEEFYKQNGSINYCGYNIMKVFNDLSMIFFAGGASLLLKNEGKKIFPDEFFLYHEDVYLSWKTRLQGAKVVMAQKSLVHHKGSVTTKKQLSSFSTFYQERNRLLNTLLFYQSVTLLKLVPFLLFDFVAKIVACIFLQRKSLMGIVKSYVWILFHSRWILKERNDIQAQRKVSDAEIMKYMSCKLIDSNALLPRAINFLSRLYAKAVRLEFYE